MVAAFAFEIEYRVDHVFDDAGAGDLSFLGDMADENDGRAAGLGEADQSLGACADLGDGARRRFGRVAPQGLNGIDDDEVGPAGIGQRRQNVFHIRLGHQLDGGVGGLQPLGAQANLGHRLLAGHIDDLSAAPGEGARGLHEQRRLADAGIAADEDCRAAHDAAAGRAVELGNARGDAGRFLVFAGQRQERGWSALAPRALRPTGRRGLLDDRIPFAAGVAFALPAIIDRAAGLANEGYFRFRHLLI